MITSKINKAYTLAEKLHEGQVRKFSGAPYFVHPKGVARLAEVLTGDENIIVAGLLHDVLEDCKVTLKELEDQFGFVIADLVREVTTEEYDKKTIQKKDFYLEKMMKMSEDALTLKLLDRLDNMTWVDNDCKTNLQQKFVKKSYEETTFIMKELRRLKKDLTQLQYMLIGQIEAKLDFIQVRHLW